MSANDFHRKGEGSLQEIEINFIKKNLACFSSTFRSYVTSSVSNKFFNAHISLNNGACF